MEMLVTKFSDGKYRNEPISDDNVRLMDEMIALQVLRSNKVYDYSVIEKLFNGLIKDFHHMHEPSYVISEGYDYAQTAICFLLPFKGRFVSEIYGDTRFRKNVTIKHACFNTVSLQLCRYRRKIARLHQIDFSNNKTIPADPVDCFEKTQTDYSKADALLKALHLTDAELKTLNCHLNGMTQSEAAVCPAISVAGVKYRKLRIRQKYYTYIGSF